jgi:hypothetical protein
MLRATLLVQQLFRVEHEIGPAPLLIVGGGAAGASAAITASRLGIDSVLIEHLAGTFARQQGVTTRRLHPSEYDWPQDHAGEPWPPAKSTKLRLPMRYTPNLPADKVAREWEEDFRNVRELGGTIGLTGRRRGVIHLKGNAHSREFDFTFGEHAVDASSVTVNLPIRSFGAMISCVGQGVEKVSIFDPKEKVKPVFSGISFWSADMLDQPMLQAAPVGRTRHEPVRALVSGGADGAQQDIHRILCAEFGLPLLERLCQFPGVRAEVESHRADLWRADGDRHSALKALGPPGVTGTSADPVFKGWGGLYASRARAVWKSMSGGDRNRAAIALLRDEVLDGRLQLTWVHRDRDAVHCYGLNRFVTEFLLLAYALHKGKKEIYPDPKEPLVWDPKSIPIALSGHEIHSITSLDTHECDPKKPADCHARLHEVKFAHANTDTVSLEGNYHVIVVRHGVDSRPLFGGAPDIEQLMPYGLL